MMININTHCAHSRHPSLRQVLSVPRGSRRFGSGALSCTMPQRVECPNMGTCCPRRPPCPPVPMAAAAAAAVRVRAEQRRARHHLAAVLGGRRRSPALRMSQSHAAQSQLPWARSQNRDPAPAARGHHRRRHAVRKEHAVWYCWCSSSCPPSLPCPLPARTSSASATELGRSPAGCSASSWSHPQSGCRQVPP